MMRKYVWYDVSLQKPNKSGKYSCEIRLKSGGKVRTNLLFDSETEKWSDMFCNDVTADVMFWQERTTTPSNN